ncbi:lcc1, laccase [Trichodelitschia bisporula]|uniref:Lcc1, laccase n=1 Tax=Trichodelitschia bisporula TaxID=703511 RepID=A0A6G1HMS4_9PEZI|nr:lcc1, laccase [Trichodelitschia bisporula]
MYSLPAVGACLLALASSTFATAIPHLAERDSACTNGPSTRSCWKDGFSVSTNPYAKFPDTGKTFQYHLDVSKKTMAFDGVSREVQVFNGQYPGPTLEADWGDTLQITVSNSLPDNGTSIHWHGLRQLNSNQMDGTNGITECPIAPGQSKTYTFKATQYGTSWYHSHYSVQYADGLVGTIKINGPATANYDIDLGVVAMTDWFHTPVFTILASRPAAPPTAQSVLYNGTSVYNGQGKYGVTTLTPGKKHLLRLVNTGINAYLHVSLDGHPFTVIANDFVPIKPYTTTQLVLAVGQRYDVVIEANQPVANYWFRIGTGGGQCDGPNEKTDTQGAIFSYVGAPSGNPTSTPYTLSTGCFDETGLVPFVALNPGSPATAPTELDLTLDVSAGVAWKVNNESILIDWTKPTLQYIENGTYTLPKTDNGITIAGGVDTWTFWLIQNDSPLPHPIHLHGHDFYVVADGTGSGTGVALNLQNPIRRDTHTVANGGYIVIAFNSDNPGAWLLHCHIPFHISGGLGVQFIERPTEVIGALGDLSGFNDGCKTWTAFENSIPGFSQGDSGL